MDKIEPTWHKGMYGCPRDMYGADIVLPLIAKLEAALAGKADVWDEGKRAHRLESNLRAAWSENGSQSPRPTIPNPYRTGATK